MIGYGSERLTQDCDRAVVASDEKLVAAALLPLGYLIRERFPAFVRYAHLGQLRPVVDVMLLDASTFEKLRAEGREIELSGVVLRALKPLHLIALKLHALKQNPARLGKDWEDIQYLLRLEEWTRAELNEVAERYASADSRQMLQQAGFL